MMEFRQVVIAALAVLDGAGCSLPGTADGLQAGPRSALAAAACPRPTDRDGRHLYETMKGSFVERSIDPGGAHFIVMKPSESAANQSVLVTAQVYEAAARVELGHAITLFAYVGNADSGAHPAYSCMEL